jgi:hypothetical protein
MKNEGALKMRLSGITESIAPMCHHFFYPRAVFPLSGRAGAGVLGHAGKNMPCPSFAMSSGRLFLDGLLASIARLRFTDFISLNLLPIRMESNIIER